MSPRFSRFDVRFFNLTAIRDYQDRKLNEDSKLMK